MVFSIAKETSWTEDHILDMPIGKLWQYRHALLRSYDAVTYYKITDEEKQEMYAIFDSM